VNQLCPQCRTPLESKPSEELYRRAMVLMVRSGKSTQQQAMDLIEQAERLLQDAIRTDPTSPNAHFGMALILMCHRFDFISAVTELQTAKKLDPINPRVRFALGKLLVHIQDYDGAEKELRAATELDPASDHALFDLGVLLLMHRHDHDGAEVCLRAAIKRNPNNYMARNSLGIILKQHRKDFDGAIEQFRLAIKIHPNDCVLHISLGNLHCEMEDYDHAEVEYLAAIQIAPDNVDAHLNLAQLLIVCKLDRHEEALGHLDKVVDLDPNQLPRVTQLVGAVVAARQGKNIEVVRAPAVHSRGIEYDRKKCESRGSGLIAGMKQLATLGLTHVDDDLPPASTDHREDTTQVGAEADSGFRNEHEEEGIRALIGIPPGTQGSWLL
jgi:tetratricopeptide (TPR) repeat protein